jgi:hypothetical protein
MIEEIAARIRPHAGLNSLGKSAFDRHSERSEKSLFGLNPRKEGFLGTQRASE